MGVGPGIGQNLTGFGKDAVVRIGQMAEGVGRRVAKKRGENATVAFAQHQITAHVSPS